jgi:hypothetical protein
MNGAKPFCESNSFSSQVSLTRRTVMKFLSDCLAYQRVNEKEYIPKSPKSEKQGEGTDNGDNLRNFFYFNL